MAGTNINIQPNVNNSSVVLAAQPSEMDVREMSSLEIADITGKQHAHVMRDIRTLIEQGVNESNFGLVDYTDKKGEKRSMYNLTKKGCLILASGYNAVLREKIIDRWELLESGKATPFVHQTKQQQLTMKDKLTWIKEVQKYVQRLTEIKKISSADLLIVSKGGNKEQGTWAHQRIVNGRTLRERQYTFFICCLFRIIPHIGSPLVISY